MKSRHTGLFVLVTIVFALVTLTSCTSVGALLRSNITGVPYWYYNPEMGVGRNNTGMVAEGASTSQRQAELLAYSAIMDNLSGQLGYRLGQEEYRELSTIGTISSLGLSIQNRFTEASNGETRVLLHVAIDKELLSQATSEESIRRSETEKLVRDLVYEGDEFIKSGQELKAVSNYIKAMTLSYGLDYIPSEFTYQELMPVVLDFVGDMNLSIVSFRSDNATCTISLTRRGTFVSSAVTSAEILASFVAEDTRGIQYGDSFLCVTDQYGQFFFNSINDAMVRDGKVIFTLGFASELDALAEVAGEAAVAELRTLVESKTVTFNYSRRYRLGSIAVSAIEHDTLGYVTGTQMTTDYVVGKFKEAGAVTSAYYPELDDEEDVLYDYQHSGSTEDCLLVLRTGIVDSVESRNGIVAVNVEGVATLFDCRTSRVLYKSDIIYASAFAPTYEEAVEEAFRKLADIAYTLVKVVYV